MNMVGDIGRYTQFEVAQSIPIAAANEGAGTAGIGAGLGAGVAMGQVMMDALRKPGSSQPDPGAESAATGAETKFCTNCGKSIPKSSKFCPECGHPQQ